MPKLIVQRPKKRRKIPPCGRLINYVEPHSPFQKLVEARRREIGVSGRELARMISRPSSKVSSSTLWIWLHNENGFPHPKAFSASHLERLAAALEIAPAEMQSALDASRHLYTPRESPVPREPLDAFRTFIGIMERDPRDRVTVSYVVNLARNLWNGAQAGASAPAPVPAARTSRRPRQRASR